MTDMADMVRYREVDTCQVKLTKLFRLSVFLIVDVKRGFCEQ